MTRARIGLSLGGTTLSAVAVRRGAVVWAAHAECAGDESVAATVGQVLAQYAGVAGARVVAALGNPYVIVKRLHGLDRVVRSDLVFRAVEQNPDRFFMTDPRGSAISSVIRLESQWVAAAFAASTVASLAEGCRQAGATLEVTVPVRAALPEGLQARTDSAPPARFQEYFDAYNAACLANRASLALWSDDHARRVQRRQGVLRAALIAAVLVAAATNVLAPTLSAIHRGRALTVALNQERDSLRPVVAAMAELAHTSGTLAEIERFGASRRSLLGMLESLASALPDSTAMLSLRADTVNATIVLLTRAGPGVLQRLAKVQGLQSPQILGAFSREEVSGVPFDRVSVRLRVASAPKSRSGAAGQ